MRWSLLVVPGSSMVVLWVPLCHLPLSSRSQLRLLRVCSWPSLPLQVWVELVRAHGFVCAGSVAWSHPTLCNPSNCSLPVSSVHGISQQEYWSGLPFPPPGDLPDPGIAPKSPASPALQADSLPTEPGGSPSLEAQMVKNRPAMCETQIQSLGWEDPLEKGMATHSSILAWRFPWTEEPGGLQSMGSQSQTRLSD